MSGILMDRYRFAPPAASHFTTFYDAGTGADPTLTDSATRGLVMDFGAGTISNNTNYVKAVTKAKPASSNYSIIARVNSAAMFSSMVGICVADGTKLITFGFTVGSGSSFGVGVYRWNSDTSINDTPLINYLVSPHCEWLRIEVVADDPKKYYVSHNGTDWQEVLDSSMTGFLTYSEVGLVTYADRNAATAFPIAGTNQLNMSVLYYSDPDIVPGF